MSYPTSGEAEIVEHHKRTLRSMQNLDTLNTLRFMGLQIVQMDRAELLGLICFLLRHSHLMRDLCYRDKSDEAR